MPKYNKKSYSYLTLPNSMKEFSQANKLETSLKVYESLNLSQKLTYKEFTKSTSCKVTLKPLELQYKMDINPTKSYSLKWIEVGYLFNFSEWKNYPRNQPFVGPHSWLYKIESKPPENKEGNQKDLI